MTNIVTPKQTAFINSLVAERAIDTALAALVASVATTLEASLVIGRLLAAPRKARALPARSPEYSEYLNALNAVEISKYAVPTKYLHAAFPEFATALRGDLLFLEVRNYEGKRYFNRLVGAPGGFSRYRIPAKTATGLLKFIAGRHVEFASLFGQHYSVCGRCAAELTDEESRRTGFGPTCRAIFGI